MSVASLVMDEGRFGLWIFTGGTLLKSLWLLTDGAPSMAEVRFSPCCCTCLHWKLLRLSMRGIVSQRAARGVLACSLLDGDDEPVWTMSGPTPLRRSMVDIFRGKCFSGFSEMKIFYGYFCLVTLTAAENFSQPKCSFARTVLISWRSVDISVLLYYSINRNTAVISVSPVSSVS
jgi:hypothetical protein